MNQAVIFNAWSLALALNTLVLAFICFARAAATGHDNYRATWWQMLVFLGFGAIAISLRELSLVYIAVKHQRAMASLGEPLFAFTVRFLFTVCELGMIRAMTHERCAEAGWLWSFAVSFSVFVAAYVSLLPELN